MLRDKNPKGQITLSLIVEVVGYPTLKTKLKS
jgi:hypothetical protein